jgi:hypothetical protein
MSPFSKMNKSLVSGLAQGLSIERSSYKLSAEEILTQEAVVLFVCFLKNSEAGVV